jgi:hypothetical protein
MVGARARLGVRWVEWLGLADALPAPFRMALQEHVGGAAAVASSLSVQPVSGPGSEEWMVSVWVDTVATLKMQFPRAGRCNFLLFGRSHWSRYQC